MIKMNFQKWQKLKEKGLKVYYKNNKNNKLKMIKLLVMN